MHRIQYDPSLDYEGILSSDAFEKYSADRSAWVEKGVYEKNSAVPDALYILAKDNIVIGSITPFGSRTEDTILEDCKITCVRIDEDCIAALKAGGISWTTNSGHLFWNEYYSNIRYDENNKMTFLECRSVLAD